MEVKARPDCAMPNSGSFTYQDEYEIIYEVSWQQSLKGLDITTVVKDPRIPGVQQTGFVRNHAIYRHGLISIERMVIATVDAGYMIVSAGGTQEEGDIQVSFPCGPRPIDPFCHHLGNPYVDDVTNVITCGTRWTDPDVDVGVSWDDVDTGGVTVSVTQQSFQWTDVWNNDVHTQSTCA